MKPPREPGAPHFIPVQSLRQRPRAVTGPAPADAVAGQPGAAVTPLPRGAVVTVRKARLPDVPEIKAIIHYHAAQDRMLSRPQAELYESIREYYVAAYDAPDGTTGVIGCCGLHVTWEDLAEVRGLAVAANEGRSGVGTRLVQTCLAEAAELGLRQVYTLTLVPEFFQRLGFHVIEREKLHLKVWYECYKCPKFDHCDEIAMIRSVGP